MKVYSLKSCDTCKKALKWLSEQGIDHQVIDVRADGIGEADLRNIVETAGWEQAVNRRSTTWRGLSDADKEGLDNDKAVRLILDNPTLMKRPIFERGSDILIGFSKDVQAALGS